MTRAWILTGVAALSACASGPSAKPIEVGTEARTLVVNDMDGRIHDLEAVLDEGGTVALVFWQTWCGSCLREAPQLAADARTYGDEILFLGVVPGPDEDVDEAKVVKLVERFQLPYPQVRDRDLALTRRFDVDGTPTILVLGSGGRILFRGHRPPDWSAWASATRP